MKVKREEVGAGDEDEAVYEADGQGGHVRAALEEAKRHDRICCEFPLIDEEEPDSHEAEDYEADDRGGGPGVLYTTVLEPEEEHYSTAGNRQNSKPIDSFQSC